MGKPALRTWQKSISAGHPSV